MREAEERQKVRGAHLSKLPAHSVLESCLQILFLQEWGLGAKGGGGCQHGVQERVKVCIEVRRTNDGS